MIRRFQRTVDTFETFSASLESVTPKPAPEGIMMILLHTLVLEPEPGTGTKLKVTTYLAHPLPLDIVSWLYCYARNACRTGTAIFLRDISAKAEVGVMPVFGKRLRITRSHNCSDGLSCENDYGRGP